MQRPRSVLRSPVFLFRRLPRGGLGVEHGHVGIHRADPFFRQMKTIPYTPISGMELFALRLAFKQHMPAIVAWLRAKEGK